jgi:acetyl-CoA carboxylase carboxyl transferase subunit beta
MGKAQMSIREWFAQREKSRYTPLVTGPTTDVADGVWLKCSKCKKTLYAGQLAENQMICPLCGHYFSLSPRDRIASLADTGSFLEIDHDITSGDPLGFTAGKQPYADKLRECRGKTGLNEAVTTGRASIGGHPAVVGAMDFGFVGASMGSAFGEKITRAFELAHRERRAVVIASSSGGARMQEGMLSLMQMAKTTAAVKRFQESGLPYISILTNPTLGGTAASFAVQADIILAEPGAVIGFAGPRVIEQTIRQKLPERFQTSEFLLEHGMIDEVVERSEMKCVVESFLDYLVRSASSGSREAPLAVAGL